MVAPSDWQLLRDVQRMRDWNLWVQNKIQRFQDTSLLNSRLCVGIATSFLTGSTSEGQESARMRGERQSRAVRGLWIPGSRRRGAPRNDGIGHDTATVKA